jgi:hypothetical protein
VGYELLGPDVTGVFVIDDFKGPSLVFFLSKDVDRERTVNNDDALAFARGDQIWFVVDNAVGSPSILQRRYPS